MREIFEEVLRQMREIFGEVLRQMREFLGGAKADERDFWEVLRQMREIFGEVLRQMREIFGEVLRQMREIFGEEPAGTEGLGQVREGYVIGLGGRLSLFEWDTGMVSTIQEVEHDRGTRFNDGKCDAKGCLRADERFI